ncbi:MAG: response regulator [Gammaproteobacteria bacterium]
MDRLRLLWIDGVPNAAARDLLRGLRTAFDVASHPAGEDIIERVGHLQPNIICFDFDYPRPADLFLLRQVKATFPSIPIIMLSAHHSADLILWALRSRVWNYLPKPIDAPDFIEAVAELREALKERLARRAEPRAGERSDRRMVLPAITSAKASEPAASRARQVIDKAKQYVETHLGEELTAAKVAEVCCMSYFHFSRTFKRVAGESFNDFVQNTRIRKAGEFLALPNATIARVCFEVGSRRPRAQKVMTCRSSVCPPACPMTPPRGRCRPPTARARARSRDRGRPGRSSPEIAPARQELHEAPDDACDHDLELSRNPACREGGLRGIAARLDPGRSP